MLSYRYKIDIKIAIRLLFQIKDRYQIRNVNKYLNLAILDLIIIKYSNN